MTRPTGTPVKWPRISIDVELETNRLLRLAAAKRDMTVDQYVLEALLERLREDLGQRAEGQSGLTAKADPVLAALWDNEKDAAYDHV